MSRRTPRTDDDCFRVLVLLLLFFFLGGGNGLIHVGEPAAGYLLKVYFWVSEVLSHGQQHRALGPNT